MEVPTFPREAAEDLASTEATEVKPEHIASTFGSDSIDLVSQPLGSRILSVSDEWFAEAANLTVPTAPISRPGVYTYAGAWYDGWETRRHNPAPFDYVVFRLGVSSGRVKGVEIDTGFFSGNQAPEIAVDGCYSADDDAVAKPDFDGWRRILGRKECGPACRQAWLLERVTEKAFTHVRLCMFPDGGIGRFRLYGVAEPVFPEDPNVIIDLAAMVNGAVATRCSDQHFGMKSNLLLPGRGKDMGDGWETKRSRGEHVDWVIIRLGAEGEIDRIVVDTAHFRGNFPQKVQIFAAQAGEEPQHNDHKAWTEVLSPQPCGADKEHEFDKATLSDVSGKHYQHVKMVIIPDGGVKRLRVFGRRRN